MGVGLALGALEVVALQAAAVVLVGDDPADVRGKTAVVVGDVEVPADAALAAQNLAVAPRIGPVTAIVEELAGQELAVLLIVTVKVAVGVVAGNDPAGGEQAVPVAVALDAALGREAAKDVAIRGRVVQVSRGTLSGDGRVRGRVDVVALQAAAVVLVGDEPAGVLELAVAVGEVDVALGGAGGLGVLAARDVALGGGVVLVAAGG